jgi:hypothetical protein
MSIAKKPVNYLNNRDMLKEIHLSKNSYCSFLDPDDHQYDLIIDLESNNDLAKSLKYAAKREQITRAREVRAARLSTPENKIEPKSIKVEDLVFRVMTWDHIPLAPKPARKTDKKKSAMEMFLSENTDESSFDDLEDTTLSKEMGMNDMVHVRVNFPPFQHFKYNNKEKEWRCVGKSHWEGDVNTGEFNKDSGQITNKLARMYLMLCERYAMRFNWRGYTYNDEMRGSAILQLTYVGLRFNEAKSSNPFAYYTAAINNSFCRVLNSEKRNQNIRDDILELNGLNPSWSRQFSSTNTASIDD